MVTLRDKPLRKVTWFPTDGIDIGIYEAAQKEGKTVSMLLEEWKSETDGKMSPYFGLTRKEVIKKKMQLRKAGQEVPLEAFEELLFEAGVRAFGARTDNVEKMFNYSDLDVLFPEYVSNRVYAGLLQEGLIKDLIAVETDIAGALDYRKIYIDDSEHERQTSIVNRGGELPTVRVTVGDRSIKLKKFGVYLEADYDDVKFQKLGVFNLILQRIGQQIQIDLTDELLSTIQNGDGNSGTTPSTTVETATSGTIVKKDLINFFTGAPTPYKVSDVIGKKALLSDVYDVLTGTYQPLTQYGVPAMTVPTFHEWDRSAVTSDELIGVDARYSMEMVTAGGIITDSEKLVKKQIAGTGIWHYVNFSVIDADANVIFDSVHS